MSKNISIVQSIYAAFGRGDVPAILEDISDECDWEYGGSTADVPWLQRRTGRAGVGAFFQAVGTELDMKSFGVSALVATERAGSCGHRLHNALAHPGWPASSSSG